LAPLWLSTDNAVVSSRVVRDELRGAVYRVDVGFLVGLLKERDWPGDALPLMGDAVLVAAGGRRHELGRAARRCVMELRDRDWEGDAELAIQIESAVGGGAAPLLRSLRVDLEELSGVLEGDPVMGGGRIDLQTGEVWPESAVQYAAETGDDQVEEEAEMGLWLRVHCEGSRAGYRDMELFIETLTDGRIADRLARSIQGRGAFRRFKDALADWPDLLDRWYGFTDDRHRGRARAWLAAEGYTPAHRLREL